MKIKHIFLYPIKSTQHIQLDTADIEMTGIRYDRNWALFDSSGQALTGREYPNLLDIKTSVIGKNLELFHNDKPIGAIPLELKETISKSLKIFSYQAFGQNTNEEIDQWFSDYIGVECKLMQSDLNRKRPVLAKHGGNDDDIVAFGDQAPLLILSEASVADLNTRLDDPITAKRFRPNIVVSDCEAYAEDQWDIIQIGSCKLRVIQQCERCVFTTIDVKTKEKHPKSEPLRTLAKYRKGPRKGVVFGVHAVPLNTGEIAEGDVLKVISSAQRSVTSSI